MVPSKSAFLSEGIDPSLSTIYICILLIIAFFALLANTAVLATIYSSVELRRPIDFYIANLAVSDIVSAFFSTFTLDNAKMQWEIGKELCKVCYYFMYLGYAVTILTLCVMSIERYHGICKPLKHRTVTPFQKCKLSIPVVWLISALVSSPYIYAYGVEDFVVSKTNKYHHMCAEKWSPDSQKAYTVTFIIILFLTPVALVIFTFSKIIEKLTSPRSASSGGNVILHKKRKRIAQMLLLMVTAHFLCWSPTLFFKLAHAFSGISSGSLSLWLWFELIHLGRSLLYPLIYVTMHRRFSSSLKELYDSCRPCGHRQNNRDSSTVKDGSAPASSVASDRSAFYYPEDELSTDM